ncbi:MAG: DUF2809 domain-containing protein [Lachnospiraceae bacterium]|nr:DUF2809 domain-containing protein [Lachnospiraceae bacterium]
MTDLNNNKLRLVFVITAVLLLITEVLIGVYATGWVRSYLGDVLVVMLLYTLYRAVIIDVPSKWFVLPSLILLIAIDVEFLQLWGICDRLGIQNRFVRILLGTSFSAVDLVCYAIGCIPCYLAEFFTRKKKRGT